ncbi:hypothetical protein WA1_18490 [Scytonema hofmannii PCC 7110]|jgi:antitoxin FitA|uniref:Arc-like DNA binding domain-containing protein n=1 Tax=Scytonema hofmannii PCC 7110 TaxID=128403 RepID=A0A139XBC0_9CYAN|nr:DUF2783 domain-containing protein [Scytonema hofmannii]KYC41997.1 hypothetical protein WA1_18490 [Scytonema hofmannii PCC 7110]
MATLHNLDLPDDLYEQLQELATAKESSINAQLITLLQNGLSVAQEQRMAEQKRQNVAQLLEESRRRREQLPTDIEWPDSTAMIREDRDR